MPILLRARRHRLGQAIVVTVMESLAVAGTWLLARFSRASNVLFLVAFIVYVCIRGVYEQRASGNEALVRRLDALERVLLVLVFAGSLLLPVIYLFTPWLGFADVRLPRPAPWCGAILITAGLWLFWRSHADLGQNWSATLQVRRGHQLVQDGVYRAIRHPMYAAILLFDLGQGLLLENWLAGWSALATFLLLYLVRAPREEQLLSEFFGEEYRDYIRQTGRLLPRRRSAKDS